MRAGPPLRDPGGPEEELERIRQRYERRAVLHGDARYRLDQPSVYMALRERMRAMRRWIGLSGIDPAAASVLEVGCGSGHNLSLFMELGFKPENLAGNELLEERVAAARASLPSGIRILAGDASLLPLPPESFDVVFQSTVFSSILDTAFQARLAAKMWELVRPGGGVLWYDFTFDNPRNPDVKGVPVRRIRELFPEASIMVWRITLAPPLSRLVTRLHPALYDLFNAVPLLRTHVLCWIEKRG